MSSRSGFEELHPDGYSAATPKERLDHLGWLASQSDDPEARQAYEIVYGHLLALDQERVKQEIEATWLQAVIDQSEAENNELLRRNVAREIDNYHLEYEGTHDSLTGIYNRAGFFQAVKARYGRLAPNQAAVLFLMDLDSFKTVNDLHGHAAGDKLLKDVAEDLDQVSESSVMARWGGDELVSLHIIDGTELRDQSFEETASRLRQILTDTAQATIKDNRLLARVKGVGISVGQSGIYIGSFLPADIDKMLLEADKSMYVTKDNNKRASYVRHRH